MLFSRNPCRSKSLAKLIGASVVAIAGMSAMASAAQAGSCHYVTNTNVIVWGGQPQSGIDLRTFVKGSQVYGTCAGENFNGKAYRTLWSLNGNGLGWAELDEMTYLGNW